MKHIMAEGKAITTKKGIKSEGQEVSADILAGGKEAFDKFVKSGHIVKKAEPKKDEPEKTGGK